MPLLKKNPKRLQPTLKRIDVSEAKEKAPLKGSLIFPIYLEERDPDLLISYANQSSMMASDSKKELD